MNECRCHGVGKSQHFTGTSRRRLSGLRGRRPSLSQRHRHATILCPSMTSPKLIQDRERLNAARRGCSLFVGGSSRMRLSEGVRRHSDQWDRSSGLADLSALSVSASAFSLSCPPPPSGERSNFLTHIATDQGTVDILDLKPSGSLHQRSRQTRQSKISTIRSI